MQGYETAVAGDVLQGDSKATLVYATQAYVGNARALAAMLAPEPRRDRARAPGVQPGVAVVLGPSYTGALVLPTEAATGPTLTLHSPQDVAEWHALSLKTKLKMRMPSAWLPGFAYDWPMSRAYTIATRPRRPGRRGRGRHHRQRRLLAHRGDRLDRPAGDRLARRSTVVKGVRYLQFYDGDKLHMVAWKVHKARCSGWSNTLDNELANDTMMGLATSFTGVK